MKRNFTTALLGTTLLGFHILAGCDRADSKDSKEQTTVTQNANGSTTVDKEKITVDPKTGDRTATSEVKTTGNPPVKP